MTIPYSIAFQLARECALADQVKEGDKAEFLLKKSASDYMKFGRPASTKGSH